MQGLFYCWYIFKFPPAVQYFQKCSDFVAKSSTKHNTILVCRNVPKRRRFYRTAFQPRHLLHVSPNCLWGVMYLGIHKPLQLDIDLSSWIRLCTCKAARKLCGQCNNWSVSVTLSAAMKGSCDWKYNYDVPLSKGRWPLKRQLAILNCGLILQESAGHKRTYITHVTVVLVGRSMRWLLVQF